MTNAMGIPYIYDVLSVYRLIAWELVLCAIERNISLDTDWNLIQLIQGYLLLLSTPFPLECTLLCSL